MDQIVTLFVRTITQAPIFLGLIALVGLIVQKKTAHEITEGVIKTIIGMVMLSTGSNLLTSTLSPLINLLNEISGVSGVLPQNFAVFGDIMTKYSTSVVFTFIGGFFLNLILARILPWKNCKNIYLTVHVALIFGSFLVVAVSTAFNWEINSLSTITLSAIIMGVYNTLSPAIPRALFKNWSNDQFTLGHQQQIGTFFAAKIAGIFGNKDQDAETIKLPKGLESLKDTTISLAILMPIIFIGIGLVCGRENIEPMAGTTHWIVFLFLQGITFTAGFNILLQGVRMFIAQILPSFKGIADKFVPGAVPALDCPVFYTFSPTGAMLGFMSALAGSILAMVITIVFKLPVVVFPSPNIVFFDGSLFGVFGNKYGGWKGAIAAGFILSFAVHILVVFLYPLTGYLYGTGATFSQTDYSIFWLPFVLVLKAIGSVFGIA